MKRLIAAFALLSLAACASAPTRYGPAASASEMGYREQRLEQERYRVSFRGNPDLKGPQVATARPARRSASAAQAVLSDRGSV